MIQPRLSTTWAYNGKDTVFVSYARYNPAASSLPRAASWDRNLEVSQNADFDANGNLFELENVAASTGKLFVPDMTPQRFDEWVVGTAKQFTTAWSGRAYFQYRKGTHYWEDTPNMSRILYNEGYTTVPGTNAADPAAAVHREPRGRPGDARRQRQLLRHRRPRRLVHRLPRR